MILTSPRNNDHEVKIILEFRTAAELIVGLTAAGDRDNASNTTTIIDSSGVSLQSAALWVDYRLVRKSNGQKLLLVY